MTPEVQLPVWARGRWVHPLEPVAKDGWITWRRNNVDFRSAGIEGLLDSYCSLERALPEEMAEFVATHGAPEVEGFEVTAGRERNPRGISVESERGGRLPIDALRRHARGIAAARRVGAALVERKHGRIADWVDMQIFQWHWTVDPDEWDDWKLGRERFAEWTTDLLRQGAVGMQADWLGTRGLALDPVAESFLGVIAILLSREIGAEGQYQCSSCGALVYRQRPPRREEAVYCDRPECKREQKRRNQAAWRARKREEQNDDQ
jgi:hypothetical protein